MKAIYWLFLLALGFFGCQYLYYSSKTRSALKSALESIPYDANNGLKKIKPVLGYSNFLTLGQAEKAKNKYFDELEKRASGLLYKPEVRIDEIHALDSCLSTLSEAQRIRGVNVKDHQKKLAVAIRDAQPQMRAAIGLVPWDAFVALMDRAKSGEMLSADAFDNLGGWLQEVHLVDRWTIGVRETRLIAARQLAEGLQALGLTPPAGDTPIFAPIPTNLDAGQLIEADQAFRLGQDACTMLRKKFGLDRTPAEILPHRAKLELVQAALRVNHLIQMKQRNEYMSAFIAKLMINPNVPTTPSDGELFGTFNNAVSQQMIELLEIFQYTGWEANDLIRLQPYALWIQVQFWNSRGRQDMAGRARSQFQIFQSDTQADPLAQKVYGELAAARSFVILLR